MHRRSGKQREIVMIACRVRMFRVGRQNNEKARSKRGVQSRTLSVRNSRNKQACDREEKTGWLVL